MMLMIQRIAELNRFSWKPKVIGSNCRRGTLQRRWQNCATAAECICWCVFWFPQIFVVAPEYVLVVKAKVEGFTLNLRRAVKIKPCGGNKKLDGTRLPRWHEAEAAVLPCIKQSAARCPSLKPHAEYRIPQVVIINETQHNSHSVAQNGFSQCWNPVRCWFDCWWCRDVYVSITPTPHMVLFRRLKCHTWTRGLNLQRSLNLMGKCDLFFLLKSWCCMSDQRHLNRKLPWHISVNVLFSVLHWNGGEGRDCKSRAATADSR